MADWWRDRKRGGMEGGERKDSREVGRAGSLEAHPEDKDGGGEQHGQRSYGNRG